MRLVDIFDDYNSLNYNIESNEVCYLLSYDKIEKEWYCNCLEYDIPSSHLIHTFRKFIKNQLIEIDSYIAEHFSYYNDLLIDKKLFSSDSFFKKTIVIDNINNEQYIEEFDSFTIAMLWLLCGYCCNGYNSIEY